MLRFGSRIVLTGLVLFEGVISGQIVPTRVSTTYSMGGARAIAVSGNLAYVAMDGLSIYDISDPATPILKGNTNTFSEVLGIAISGSYAYLACREYGLRIFDVSDPEHPINVGNTNNGGLAARVAISGSLAYLANDDDGLRIYDISDPRNPVNVGHVTSYTGNYEYCQQVAISGHHAYVANTSDGLRVYNIDDPTSPISVAHVTNGATRVVLSGQWAYVKNAGVEIYNIADPTNLVRVAQIPYGGYWITVSDKYLFIGGGVDGVRVYNIASPSAPVFVTQFGGFGSLFSDDMAILGSNLFIASVGSGMIVYATLPIVKIVPASSDFVRVSWPSPSPGYKLKGTYELVSQNWFTITNAPLEFAGEYRLYLPKDVPKLFFRLAYE